MIIKLCGFTRADQAARAAQLGATHIGVVLWAGSRRCASAQQAREVFAAARAHGAEGVAVLVDHDDPVGLARDLGASRVQLHGDEPQEVGAALLAAGVPFWRALRIGAVQPDPAPWLAAGADAVLLDALVPGVPGGTGARVDTALAARLARSHPVVLAGGLNPGNVAEAIAAVRPLGVDVASGIERAPGDKDEHLMQQFVTAARAALLEIP